MACKPMATGQEQEGKAHQNQEEGPLPAAVPSIGRGGIAPVNLKCYSIQFEHHKAGQRGLHLALGDNESTTGYT